MKFIAPALIFCGAAVFGQSPQVPHKIQFAGLTLTLRDDARREIQTDVDALTKHPKYFNIKVERAKTYFPTIEKIFAEERLPEDFKYLSLQESALIPDAVSSSDAVGFWQFKDFTAREMGLRVDEEIDERMNIASASRGAARYLKQCNHYFNNWVYALQAYQMGAGGVMRMVGDKDLGVRHMEITSETYWYVKKFIAHKIAFENSLTGEPSLSISSTFSAGGKTLLEVAGENSADHQQMLALNKWLKTDKIPIDRQYAVLIPFAEGTGGGIEQISPIPVTASVLNNETSINGIPVIIPMKGEGIQAIARRGNISLSAFLHNNEMTIDQPLKEGRPYFLHKKNKRSEEDLYTVKANEDLWSISQQLGVQQKFLIRFNDLEKDFVLKPGTTLYTKGRKPAHELELDSSEVAVLDAENIFTWDQVLETKGEELKSDSPIKSMDLEASLSTETHPDQSIHEVRSSDTLYSVARQYGVTIKDLMEWNEKKDFTLSVGEKLKVRSR